MTELTDDSSFRGWIAVERRSDLHRRDGDASPVIAEMQADNADSIYVSLHRIASDNVAVAREIRRWEARRAGER